MLSTNDGCNVTITMYTVVRNHGKHTESAKVRLRGWSYLSGHLALPSLYPDRKRRCWRSRSGYYQDNWFDHGSWESTQRFTVVGERTTPYIEVQQVLHPFVILSVRV